MDALTAEELMARDHQNLRATAEDGRFRSQIYRFLNPSITAGRHSVVSDEDLARWRSHGHDFARRPTGGGILRHQDDLSFGFVFPTDGFAAESVRSVSLAIKNALSKQGIETVHSGATGAPAQCFQKAVGCELLLDGEKLLGLAARKIRGAILVQGSMIVKRDEHLDQLLLAGGPRVDLSRYAFDERVFEEAVVHELSMDEKRAGC